MDSPPLVSRSGLLHPSVSVKAWTGGWVVSSGAADAISGVQDINGVAFEPRLFIVQGNTVLNTMGAFYRASSGFDDLITRLSMGTEDTTFAGLKLTCTGTAGNYSLLDERSQFTFGGFIARLGYIDSTSLGGFHVTYDVNVRPGDYISVTALGGDDIEWAIGQITAGTHSLGFEASALLTQRQNLFSASNATSGGGGYGYGFASKQSAFMGALAGTNGDPSPVARYQRPDRMMATLSGSTLVDARTVTDWGVSGITFDGGGSANHSYLAIGGDHVVSAGGVRLQPLTPTTEVIDCGIAPIALFVGSYGTVPTAGGVVLTDSCEFTYGMADGVRQTAYWAGENIAFDTAALHGARYLSNQNLLLFATPNAGSSVFNSVLNFISFDQGNRTFTVDWPTVDGVAREWFWLVLGSDEVPPTPTPVPPITTLRSAQWALQRFDAKIRREQRM